MILPPRRLLRSRHFTGADTLQVRVWLHDLQQQPMERFAVLSWLWADGFHWIEDGYMDSMGSSRPCDHRVDGWRQPQPWGERIEGADRVVEVRPLSALLEDPRERERLSHIDFDWYERRLTEEGRDRRMEWRLRSRDMAQQVRIEDEMMMQALAADEGRDEETRHFGLRHWAARLKPMAKRRHLIPHARRLDRAEVARLRRGYWPADQDDRWVAWLSASHLRFWRSWTGHCIYELPVASEDANGVTLRELRILGDGRRYRREDDGREVEMVNELIKLAMGEPLSPYLPGFIESGAHDGGET
jgi:hypothetical protein